MKFSLLRTLSSGKTFRYILLTGIVLRLLFVFIGGKIYYGKSDFYVQGDTPTWFYSFKYLVETGTYTIHPESENGKFFRPPGYSFLFGAFYLVTGKDYVLAQKMLMWLQVLMDIMSIWIIARIASMSLTAAGEKTKTLFSNCAALLYAVYPFVIVWAPVLYAETPSLFFLLLSVYFGFRSGSAKDAFLSGIFGGIAVLMRLQCIFVLPFLGLVFLSRHQGWKKKIRPALLFGMGILVTYGLWPARNYFLQDRLLFSQDLNIGSFWSPDYMSFMDYVFSVRTDYNSVYDEIIHGRKVNWPAASYINDKDAALLDSITALCARCGTGFSYFMVNEGLRSGYVPPDSNCDQTIAAGFQYLVAEQKKHNKLNYWVTVPLTNLQKCLFKSSLYGKKSTVVKVLSSTLFFIRSFLLLLGIAGLYLGWRKGYFKKVFVIFIAGYMASWYFFLSFFYRNMEMRYLLQADVLLLIPAAYVILLLLSRKNQQGI